MNGLEQPIKYWTPSPALCPLEFYTGELFPKWKNQAFIGALAFEEIKRLALEESEVKSEEVFFKGFGRVRDIKTGPEGALYVVLNNPDAVVRLTPLAGN
jgi:glucose/arabinose dehydrogenase